MKASQELLERLVENNMVLAKEIRRKRKMEKRRSNDKAYALIITVLKIFLPKLPPEKIEECITDDNKDASIDAIYIPKKKNENIKIFHISASPPSYKDMLVLKQNLEEYALGNKKLTGLSDFIKNKIKKIRKLTNRKIEIFICWKKFNTVNDKSWPIWELKADYSSIYDIHVIPGAKIIEKYIEEKIKKSKEYIWNVKLLDKNALIVRRKRNKEKVSVVIGRLNILSIVKLLEEFNNQGLDLFEKNVREFKRKKELSEEIKRSLEENPKDFFIFHNGITFVCDSIESEGPSCFKIKNPQVINGCQSINTFYNNFYKKSKEKRSDIYILKKAAVLCKFYVLPEKKVEKVCQSTNTQIKINKWDLRSNDVIQRIIEKFFELEFKKEGIKYKRKETSRKKNVVCLTQLTQWIYSAKFENPAEAKNKKSLLFDIVSKIGKYSSIFDENLSLKEIKDIVEIGLFVRNKIKERKKMKKFEEYKKYTDFHIIAALYFMRKNGFSKGYEYDYEKVIRIIPSVVESIREKYGKDISLRSIFTQKKETWELIKKRLKGCEQK